MNKLHIQNISENQYVAQQTVDSDKTNSQGSIKNKQSIASQRHYSSSMSEHSKENIPVAEMRDRSAHQTLNCQTDTNSGINVVNEKYSEAVNELLEMPTYKSKFHGEKIAKFVIEALNNQRIDFSSIATAFCKKTDTKSNLPAVSAIACSLAEMVNTGHNDVAAEIIANMVDNGRVDTAEHVLRLMRAKNYCKEIGKILGEITNKGRVETVFSIIFTSVSQSHSKNITIAVDMLYAMVKEEKTNVVAEIINQIANRGQIDNAIKILVSIIKWLGVDVARKIINEISDAKQIDMITKFLSHITNMKFDGIYQTAAKTLKQIFKQAKKQYDKIKILQEINSQSFFAIADVIVEMINKNDIEFALSIFKTIDQRRRPNVLSAMDAESRRTLCNILKERSML